MGNDTYYVGAGDVVNEEADAGIDTVDATSLKAYTVGENVENLYMAGNVQGALAQNGRVVIGNGLDNVLTIANRGDRSGGTSDVVDGGAGADIMSAGVGEDTYYVDNTGDVVIENAMEGYFDTVISSVSYTVSANVEIMTLAGSGLTATGNAMNNTYNINDLGNSIIEVAGGGTDTVVSTVDYTLDDNVENLALTGNATYGKGNALDNTLSGAGRTLEGGTGNDTYYVIEGTTVIEDVNAGIDTVVALNYAGPDQTANFATGDNTVNFTLSENVENLVIRTYIVNGFSYHGYGVGNGSDNILRIENDAANTDVLDGGAGADTMEAGWGSDTYYVDNIGDRIIEVTGDAISIDTVISSVSYTLGADVENLTLMGTSAINGTGNNLNNAIKGTADSNILNGGAGSDVLTGYAGSDTFVFDTAPGAGVDTITDYTSGSDSMQLALAMFSGIGATGELSATAFVSGSGLTAATTASEHIVYDTTAGMLYYDADGAGGAASVAFASLNAAPALTAADFAVV